MVEALLFIVALTALHLAAMAMIDVLSGPRSWPTKLAWALAIVLLPLVGAIAYYLRAGKERKRAGPRAQPPGSTEPADAAREQEEPGLRPGSE